MKKYKRIFVIVMDSLGVGQANDAHLYGVKANAFGNMAKNYQLSIQTCKN